MTIKSLKTFILKEEGGFSWTKFYYWVTTVCGIIALLPSEMAKLGMTITPQIQHLVALAGMVSFLIAGIRSRNASSPSIPAPVAPIAPASAPTTAAPVINTKEAPKA